jgi:hypothetical protein
MKIYNKQSTQNLLSNFDKQLKSIIVNDLINIQGKTAGTK